MRRILIAACSSVVILLLATSANAGLDEKLVFYLTFDNITDQTVVDKSGNGLDVEMHEHTKIMKGKYGDAIHITDDGQDCVSIPSQEKLKVTGEITMMTWIYYQETWKGKRMLHWLDKGCHSGDGWSGTYGMGSSDIGAGPEIVFFFGSRNKRGITDRHEFAVSHKMDIKKWHHVAGSYDAKTMKIYLDGKVIAAEKKEFNFFGGNNVNLRVGCAKNRHQYAFANGLIDETAVWQRALSDGEIKRAMVGDFLAVSPGDKVATTWADVKRRTVIP